MNTHRMGDGTTRRGRDIVGRRQPVLCQHSHHAGQRIVASLDPRLRRLRFAIIGDIFLMRADRKRVIIRDEIPSDP